MTDFETFVPVEQWSAAEIIQASWVDDRAGARAFGALDTTQRTIDSGCDAATARTHLVDRAADAREQARGYQLAAIDRDNIARDVAAFVPGDRKGTAPGFSKEILEGAARRAMRRENLELPIAAENLVDGCLLCRAAIISELGVAARWLTGHFELRRRGWHPLAFANLATPDFELEADGRMLVNLIALADGEVVTSLPALMVATGLAGDAVGVAIASAVAARVLSVEPASDRLARYRIARPGCVLDTFNRCLPVPANPAAVAKHTGAAGEAAAVIFSLIRALAAEIAANLPNPPIGPDLEALRPDGRAGGLLARLTDFDWARGAPK